MVLSTDEVEKLLQNVEGIMEKGFEKKDADLAASAYSEDAVFLHLGKSVVRGRKAIAEALAVFIGLDPSTVQFEKTAAYDVNNGEYLMRKGRYRVADGDWFKYMQLFEKQSDGSYLVTHDEFEFN